MTTTTNTSTPAQMLADPATFQANVLIPSAHRGTIRFGDVMADFQGERFAQINPSLLAVARGEKPQRGKHWWEATKGASKDSDLAVCIVWLLAASPRPLLIQVAAADREQADELRKAAKHLLRLNSWLAAVLDIQHSQIKNIRTDSTCDIIPADVAGSQGARPDVLICNELSCVTKREFVENLMDNSHKVPHGVVVIATNAGFLETWQHDWRTNAIDSDRWTVNIRNTPAPWIDPADIDEARKRNTPERFARLWGGVWGTGEGGALDPMDVEACITLPGPMPGRFEQFTPIIGGLDIGLRNDHSALCLLALHPEAQKFRLASSQSWAPADYGGMVDLGEVERACLDAKQRYGVEAVAYDPHQAEFLAQRLRAAGLQMIDVAFSQHNINLMAERLIASFKNRVVSLYDDPQLKGDLLRLQIVERQWGYKLQAPRGEHGHCDRGIAFTIALSVGIDWMREITGPNFIDFGDRTEQIAA